MLPRKNQQKQAVILPKEWSSEVESLLEKLFLDKLEDGAKKFEVFARTYPDEVHMVASFLTKDDLTLAPITYEMSADLDGKTKEKVILDGLVDSIGVFFETYFATENWEDYNSRWEEAQGFNINFFYRVTRENVGLTLAADQLLGEDF